MAAKKAVKKAAKKAAKKIAKHHDDGRHEGKDVRRAYEHLGRMEALRPHLSQSALGQVTKLTGMAHESLQQEDFKSAADLLRAGEHLGFADLASVESEAHVPAPLQAAIVREYEHLWQRAEDRWREHGRGKDLSTMYDDVLASAKAALSKAAYRRALEFVRAAEALAHVRGAEGAQEPGAGKRARAELSR